MLSSQELAKKLADLDARDKRLRQEMTKRTELSNAKAYIGSCPDMCPERERYLRLGSQISIFERDENNLPDESAMVKEYRRAGADQEEPLPHDLRTPQALETTMDYLVCNLMDDPRSKSQELALEWYDFLWDRLRAIRKDITQQNICDQASARLVERCTRFHVHSCYALNRVKDFDVDMNKRNLNDCLQMLRQMYNDLKMLGTSCQGELEYQKYDILLHLDEDPLSSNVILKTSEYRSSVEMKFITKIFSAYTNNDYYEFFKLLEKADYMESCILGLYINKMRLRGIRIIIAACTSKQVVWYPTDIVIEALRFDDLEDLKDFARALDIDVHQKDSKHYLLMHKDLIACLRHTGHTLPPVKSKRLIENKMQGLTVGQLVYGNLLVPQLVAQKPSRKSIDETVWTKPPSPIREEKLRPDLVPSEPIKLQIEATPHHSSAPKPPQVSYFTEEVEESQLERVADNEASPQVELTYSQPQYELVEEEVDQEITQVVDVKNEDEDRKRYMDFPVGRFRRSFMRKSMKRLEPDDEEKVTSNKKLCTKKSVLDLIRESIHDESTANNKLLKLVMTF